MNASDNTPEQRIWRGTWASEHEDPAWTREMRVALTRKARALLGGSTLEVSNLSCRDTICRMILRFETDRDAMAFQDAPHDPTLHHEYQSFDPDYDGDPDVDSAHRYEFMLKRPPPAGYVFRASREIEVEGEVGSEPEEVMLISSTEVSPLPEP